MITKIIKIKLKLTHKLLKNIFDFTFDDFDLTDYQSHPHIKGKVAV